MGQFKAELYQLSDLELDKLDVVERAFESYSNLRSSYLYQNINLDWREPTLIRSFENIAEIINVFLINYCRNKNVFAIDIVTADDNVHSRYMLVSADNYGVNDAMHSSFKLSEHMGGSMSNPKNDVPVYTLDDIFEE